MLAFEDSLCLDPLSRPDAFARLWPKLRAGYMPDALERLDGKPTLSHGVAQFIGDIAAAAVMRGPSVGLGEDVRLRGARVKKNGRNRPKPLP